MQLWVRVDYDIPYTVNDFEEGFFAGELKTKDELADYLVNAIDKDKRNHLWELEDNIELQMHITDADYEAYKRARDDDNGLDEYKL